MQRSTRPFFFLAVLALVAASTLALTGAFAGDEPAAKPGTPAATDAPAVTAEAPATKTTSPIHSMMGWMAKTVVGDLESPCPSCPKAEKAWRAWFDGGADVPLAGLRDRLVSDGWTADRYIAFFKKMAAESHASAKASGACGGCKGDCSDCPDKGSCDDCPGKGSCGDCPDKGSCGDCPNKGGCHGSKEAAPEPAGTAAK